MKKLNDFTGLLCAAILAILLYQMFAGKKDETSKTGSFMGRRR